MLLRRGHGVTVKRTLCYCGEDIVTVERTLCYCGEDIVLLWRGHCVTEERTF